jgi:hypothetical protein
MKITVSPWTITTIATTSGLLVALAAFAHAHFGSVSTALDYVSGERVLLDQTSKTFGTVDAGSTQVLQFVVMNKTDHPLNILGSKTSCGCTVVENLPMSIPAGSFKPVGVVVKTDSFKGQFNARIRLFSEEKDHPEINFEVRGYIRSKKQQSTSG